MKEIQKLINRDSLQDNSRRRDKVNKRCYLYFILRENGLSLRAIGDMFCRDHATVIYGISRYKSLVSVRDKVLELDISEYKNLLE